MTQTGYSIKDYDIFIGIDVDKSKFSFTVSDNGIMKKTKTIPSNPQYLYNYIQNNYSGKRVICAYEAGPTGFHLYDYLKEREINCLVISPLSIPKAPNERVKNNHIDSRGITKYLESEQLRSIRIPEGIYRELRHLVKIREIYTKNRKTEKQRIKALLLSQYLYPSLKDPESKWSGNYIKDLKQISISPALRSRLDMLLMDLEYAQIQILTIHKILKAFCKSQKDIKKYLSYLQSIPGIGFIAATSILGKVGNHGHLKNQRELAAFIGLVPCEYSTGDDINKGPITHLGDRTLRSILIEAAWVSIQKSTRLNQFYNRIKKRHHPKIASKKAIVAVARKLTAIIYRVLKDQREYMEY